MWMQQPCGAAAGSVQGPGSVRSSFGGFAAVHAAMPLVTAHHSSPWGTCRARMRALPGSQAPAAGLVVSRCTRAPAVMSTGTSLLCARGGSATCNPLAHPTPPAHTRRPTMRRPCAGFAWTAPPRTRRWCSRAAAPRWPCTHAAWRAGSCSPQAPGVLLVRVLMPCRPAPAPPPPWLLQAAATHAAAWPVAVAPAARRLPARPPPFPHHNATRPQTHACAHARRREKLCDFCSCELPDWKHVLTPSQVVASAPAVMNVNFDNKTYSFHVSPGARARCRVSCIVLGLHVCRRAPGRAHPC
jgi:hypothetical protein